MREKFLILKQLYTRKLVGEKYCEAIQIHQKQSDIFKDSDIENMIQNCTLCELHKKSKEKIIGQNIDAPITFITLKPLAQNGASAEMLNNIARNIFGANYSLFSLIKCDAHGEISANHVSMCKEYIKTQLDSNKSTLNIILGLDVARYIMNTNESLENLRTRVIKSEFSQKQKNFIVTFELSDLIKQPNLKKYAFEDFKYAKNFLDKNG